MLYLQYKNLFKIASSIAVLIFLIYSVFSYYSLGERPWIFFNSDNGIPYLYQDLVQKSGSITQWNFAAVNNFFPDIVLFFIVETVINSIRTSILLVGVIQLVFFYVLMVAIGKQVIKKKEEVFLIRLSLLGALMLLANGSFLNKEIMEAALVSWLHFGTMLMCLVGLLLILRTYQSPHPINFVLLFIICFLTSFSDLLFIVQFSSTAFLSLVFMLVLFRNDYKNVHIKNIIVILSGTLIGYVIYKLSFFGLIHSQQEPEIIKRTHWADWLNALFKLQEVFTSFYRQSSVILYLFFSYFFIIGTYLIRKFTEKAAIEEIKFLFVHLMLFFGIIIGFFSFILLDNDLMVGGYLGIRHYQPILLFPIFLGVPLCLAKWTNVSTWIVNNYYCFLLAMVFSVYFLNEKGSVLGLRNYYPKSVACLDNYVDQYHLQNGATNYWKAKSYSFLSKKHLNIVAVTPDIRPQLTINTKHDYDTKRFTFLIIQDKNTFSPSYPPGIFPEKYLTDTQLTEKLGKPLHVLQCPSPLNDGKENIYIYKNLLLNL